MARLTNTERKPVTLLETRHVIPGLGALDCTDETITANAVQLSGPIAAGQIIAEYDPEPEPEKPVKKAKA